MYTTVACGSDEIFDGETRHVVAASRSDLLVGFDDDLFGRVEPRLAERRHRRSRAGDHRRGARAAVIAADAARRLQLLCGGGLAVVLDHGGRGYDGRGRGGGHEIAAAAATGVLPPALVLVSERRVRAEHHRPVTLAETPGRVVGGEYAAERVPELGVEYRIDDGVERRVGVAEPREHLERGFGYARLAERRDDVDAEERHPAQQERAHDHAHRDGRLVVAHVVRRRVMVHGRQRGRRRGGRRRGRGGQRPGDRPDALHVLLCVPVQPAVDADHHHARYVETDARRYDGVLGRQVQRAPHVLGVARVEHHRFRRPVDAQYADGHHRHERGQRPHSGDAEQSVPPVQIRRVPV